MIPSESTSLSKAPPLAMPKRVILSVMMFLQFAIWGSWFIFYFPFLTNRGFTDSQAALIMANVSIGAIISTLFAGYLADRWVNSERLMGVCHLVGAGLLYLMSQITSPDQFWLLFAITLTYSLFFNPTLSVINSLTFRNVPDGERDFPTVRVFGTLGWICAGVLLDILFHGSVVLEEGKEPVLNTIATNGPILQATVLSLIFGIYCLVALPKTPPADSGAGALDFLRALAMLKDFHFAVFFFVTFIASIAMGMYFTMSSTFLKDGASVKQVGSTLAIGQGVEWLFLLFLPFCLKRFGIKTVLAVGLGAWALRYLLFAQGGKEGIAFALVIAGVALHGLCFDFFFAAGFIHADRSAPRDLRASAQSMLGLLVYGIGICVGTLLSGRLIEMYTDANKVIDWYGLWMVPTAVLAITWVLFILLFRAKPYADEVSKA